MRFIVLLVILGFVCYTGVSARPQDAQEDEIIASPESYSLSDKSEADLAEELPADEQEEEDESAADEEEAEDDEPADEEIVEEELVDEEPAEEVIVDEESVDDEPAEDQQAEEEQIDEQADEKSVGKPIVAENPLESFVERIRNFFGKSDKN